MRTYYVYFMGSTNSNVIYIGVTNNLERRVYEHKTGTIEGFTKRYKCTKLLYFEDCPSISLAIDREKELKGWSRAKKENLIDSFNSARNDMAVF